MGAQLRIYRRRIKSVQNIKKITRAMELIATSRIVKAQQRVAASQPYAGSIREVLRAAADASSVDHPLVGGTARGADAGSGAGSVAVVVLTSDRGLAGGYSSNVLKQAEQLRSRLSADGHPDVDIYAVGRKAVGYFRFRGVELAATFTGFSEQPSYADAKRIAAPLVAAFLPPEARGPAGAEGAEGGNGDGEVRPSGGESAAARYDEIWLCSTNFVSMLTQRPRAERILPVDLSAPAADGGPATSGEGDEPGSGRAQESSGPKPLYEFEPSPEAVLDALLPRYVEATLYAHLLEAAASESAARRRAMKSATDNAEELIKSYTRMANTARQAEITQEISEIVGGADALTAAG